MLRRSSKIYFRNIEVKGVVWCGVVWYGLHVCPKFCIEEFGMVLKMGLPFLPRIKRKKLLFVARDVFFIPYSNSTFQHVLYEACKDIYFQFV